MAVIRRRHDETDSQKSENQEQAIFDFESTPETVNENPENKEVSTEGTTVSETSEKTEPAKIIIKKKRVIKKLNTYSKGLHVKIADDGSVMTLDRNVNVLPAMSSEQSVPLLRKSWDEAVPSIPITASPDSVILAPQSPVFPETDCFIFPQGSG